MTPEEHLDRAEALTAQIEELASPGGAGLSTGGPVHELLLLAHSHVLIAQAQMSKDQGKRP